MVTILPSFKSYLDGFIHYLYDGDPKIIGGYLPFPSLSLGFPGCTSAVNIQLAKPTECDGKSQPVYGCLWC